MQDELIDVSLDPPYFSLDNPFKVIINYNFSKFW